MTKKQEYLLQLFREVDEICKKYNLRYVMAGGTLIGVLRHEGFVPWDDDVDLYMPRDDWDKFVKICEKELPENRAIQCVDVDRNYTNSFPRYASTDTCVIHKSQIIGKDCAGEIIDVLTLDPIPADDKEYEKYRKYMMIYSDLVNISVVYGHRFEVPAGTYLKYLISYVLLGKQHTLKKLEKKMFSYREEDCDRYAMRWGGCPFLFEKDMMFPVKYREFEGEQVMVPNRCSDYLIWHYGDEWSYLPPHGEREGHVAVSVEGASYEEFREDYMPDLRKFKLRLDAASRKYHTMKMAKKAHKIQQESNELKARSVAMDLKARLAEEKEPLKQLLAEQKYHELNKIFAGYYQTQLSAAFIGREDYYNIYPFYHPTFIQLEKETFAAAMLTLFYTERMGKAYRMLQICQGAEQLEPEMKQLMEDIELFRKAASHYEFGELDTAEKMIRELSEKWPNHPGLLKFQCRFSSTRAQQDPSELQELLAQALKLFPEDGYFLKYEADLKWMNGQKRAALQLYAQAREKTTNGIVLLELDKFLREWKLSAFETIHQLLSAKQKADALELAELWCRLLPEGEEVRGMYGLVQVELAKTQSGLEKLLEPIVKKAEKIAESAAGKEEAEDEILIGIYQRVMARAWKRLGYPWELAQFRAKLVFTREESELEWLAEEIRGYQIHKDKRAEVFKLIGDVRTKQGQTRQAFDNYLKALQYVRPSYVKTELARIILNDMSTGSTKTAMYAKKADVSVFMDSWLGKYGSLEEIQQLAQKIV